MSSNVKSKTGSATDLTPDPPTKPIPDQESPSPEDWTDPAKQHQMSAIWPLMWLAVPLVALILYGLLTRQ